MSGKEYQTTLKAVNKQRKKVTANVEESRRYLIALGVLTPQGEVTESYKNLCIPHVPT